MKPVVIGIAGKIGAGKDAVAEHLAKKHSFKIVRFADALKEEILNTMRLTCEEIWKSYQNWQHIKDVRLIRTPDEDDLRQMLWIDKPPIVRRLLQEWGTELRRAENPSYWINKWQEKIDDLMWQGHSVVSPDMRFENEYTAVIVARGITMLVTRPGTEEGDHASETGVANYDANMFNEHVHNSGSLEDLGAYIDHWLVDDER